ncbi:protein FAM107B isoform X2 [Osmerus eperlanus]|uniref:protein FAM107B n=1 Tax=Osmerus mordax TaxID=8014 RepID=UPI002E159023
MAQRVTQSLYPPGHTGRPRDVMVKSASAYADLQWEQIPAHDGSQKHRQAHPQGEPPHASSYVPQPDYTEAEDDLIKPKKLVNPVKSSKSHQDLHRELLLSHKRGGVSVETKPELQRVLEARKREQMIKQRKVEDDARKKVSPLEQELQKRHKKLEELDKEQEKLEEETGRAPEFVKVKENLRRTSFHSKGEKEV